MCISSPETNSWSVIYRKNSGEDINITSLTFKNSLLAARTLMVPENYMICILRNGERVRRWDREILAGSKMDKACELAEKYKGRDSYSEIYKAIKKVSESL